VVLKDNVEIGANTTIDRGAIEDTVIETGVKIDNIVQVAHNCKIGDNTAIASHAAIAGSTTIGAGCTISGQSGIVGHIDITDNVHITGMTVVNKSIDEPGAYSSGTLMQPYDKWRKSAARFRQLDELAKKVRELEKKTGQSQSK